MLRLITYNCYNVKSSLQDICELCKLYNVIFLQETWLFGFEFSMLSNIHSEFEGVGTSAIDLSSGLFSGLFKTRKTKCFHHYCINNIL